MSFANGQVPDSARLSLPGANHGLLREAALAYRAVDLLVPEDMSIFDGSVGRTYRTFAMQVLAKQIFGSNAATPGTSNHGYALAVDLANAAQRAAIDRVGARFGLAKRWSDASWEWWHIKYRAGVWHPRPNPLRFLAPHQKQAASTLLFRRRKRAQEGRSGKGARWRRWDRAVTRSYKRVEKLRQRANNTRRKAILKQVLDDRNGTL